MKTAKICKTWELNFDSLQSEDDVSLHKRSYLHYASEHADFVAAKSWATKWLLEDILDTDAYSCHEYMAGIGVQTILVQKLFNIRRHIVGELDKECIEHLEKQDWDFKPVFKLQDAKTAIQEVNDADIKLMDLPSSSILKVNKDWKDCFFPLFENEPKLVVWTDTSITYPISIHGEKYRKIFESEELTSKEDYIHAYSVWLYKNFGYSIKRAAIRGRNAVYFAALPGLHKTTIKEFPLKENLDGFYFLGEERATLDGL
jgi:hypothetical protein